MVTTDPHDYLPVALTAADVARDLIRTSHPGAFTEKADRDLVSDVDLAVERALRSYLHHATPAIGFLGEEEGGPADQGAGWLWTLDPIDGTSNYAHGIPLCATSLALLRDGRPVLGVIDAPFLGERFHACEGAGAWSGDHRLSASRATALREAIVAIGDYATGPGAAAKNETQLSATASLTPRVHRIRMLGTAALDLAWVAGGRLDASVTFSNQPWDMAAGIILAREAGAAVTDASGALHTLSSAATVAAAPGLISQLIPLLQTASSDAPGDPRDEATGRLDQVLSRTRCLIFDFDGAIRALDSDAPAAYLYETLAACRDSGRTSAVFARSSEASYWLYRHDLTDLAGPMVMLNDDGEVGLGIGLTLFSFGSDISVEDCTLVTATAATVKDARRTGLATIGYATTPDARRELSSAGATAVVPSLADLALRLRAHPG